MKKTLTLLLFLTSYAFCYGQSDTLCLHIDKDEKLCDESHAVYERIAIRRGEIWEVEDHYTWDWALRMKGNFSDDSFKIKQGFFSYYYENGRTEQSGTFVDGKNDGLWIGYNEHGQHRDSSLYMKGHFLFSYHWDEGHLSSRIVFDSTGKGEEWGYFNGGLKASYGKYLEGYIKDSIWTYYYLSGGISCKEYYMRYPGIKKDSLLRRECYDESGHVGSNTCEAEIMPRCHSDINRYLSRNIRFPSAIRENAKLPFSRMVIINFVINERGLVTNVRVFKHGGLLLDREAMRVVSDMPLWDPGISHNRPVKVKFTLPIMFKLE